MIEHRQQLLTSMGVALWAPRQVAVRSVQPRTIWRDQSSLESEVIVHVEDAPQHVIEQLEPKKVVPVQTKQVDIQKTQVAPALEEKVPLTQALVVSKTTINEFHLHALVGEKFVLITEQQQLPLTGQTLWRNIQKVLNLSSADLQWPFPVLDLQDGNAVHDYIKGFFDVIAAEKQVFCLGQLSIQMHTSLEILPSLEQMLEQPLNKQVLWEKVSPLIK